MLSKLLARDYYTPGNDQRRLDLKSICNVRLAFSSPEISSSYPSIGDAPVKSTRQAILYVAWTLQDFCLYQELAGQIAFEDPPKFTQFSED
ncbi:uncharacterized protein VTP21DRAFT_7444 [Calcarisporiella thermophila]|uniref:uncharacterized protein n=1 Tax=Calcarisporiella thermophila TaxID=911321 RepID=UPI003742B9AB